MKNSCEIYHRQFSKVAPTTSVSNYGSTCGGGHFGQNGQKLHETYKSNIFLAKQSGTWVEEGETLNAETLNAACECIYISSICLQLGLIRYLPTK